MAGVGSAVQERHLTGGDDAQPPFFALSRSAACVVLALTVLLCACDTLGVWMSGTDRENYTWEPHRGTDPQSLPKALAACETPGSGATAPDTRAADRPRIVRSEGSPAVADCMSENGYWKSYKSRSGAW